jgi:hypothetical protein
VNPQHMIKDGMGTSNANPTLALNNFISQSDGNEKEKKKKSKKKLSETEKRLMNRLVAPSIP